MLKTRDLIRACPCEWPVIGLSAVFIPKRALEGLDNFHRSVGSGTGLRRFRRAKEPPRAGRGQSQRRSRWIGRLSASGGGLPFVRDLLRVVGARSLGQSSRSRRRRYRSASYPGDGSLNGSSCQRICRRNSSKRSQSCENIRELKDAVSPASEHKQHYGRTSENIAARSPSQAR
jgi:hypothetical protein